MKPIKLPRRKTPAKMKKEMDTLFSRKVRDRDKICQKCLKAAASQCAHIFERGKLSTRWDEENALGFCFYCHLYWAHRSPVEFTLWVIERMGKEKFAALKRKSQKIYDSSNLKRDWLEMKKYAAI